MLFVNWNVSKRAIMKIWNFGAVTPHTFIYNFCFLPISLTVLVFQKTKMYSLKIKALYNAGWDYALCWLFLKCHKLKWNNESQFETLCTTMILFFPFSLPLREREKYNRCQFVYHSLKSVNCISKLNSSTYIMITQP